MQENIIKGVYNFDDPAWHGVSEASKHFIRKLLQPDINSRWITEAAYAHYWLDKSDLYNRFEFEIARPFHATEFTIFR